MEKKSVSIIVAAAILVSMTSLTAAAQGAYQSPQYQNGSRSSQYEDAYRSGYRTGYQAGRHRARFDDRPPRFERSGPSGYGGDPSQRWQRRYGQTYTYNDDRYYQECRNTVDPAGVLAGALIGGLLGNAAGRGRTTAAGIVVGGALGGVLTQHLDCEDRSYAYKTYYDGLNSGRPNSDWQWENPDNDNYGDFRVGDYYYDADGFRCATYTQQVYINGRPRTATGRACQQPDGVWAIVN
jgi:surface antigen